MFLKQKCAFLIMYKMGQLTDEIDPLLYLLHKGNNIVGSSICRSYCAFKSLIIFLVDFIFSSSEVCGRPFGSSDRSNKGGRGLGLRGSRRRSHQVRLFSEHLITATSLKLYRARDCLQGCKTSNRVAKLCTEKQNDALKTFS